MVHMKEMKNIEWLHRLPKSGEAGLRVPAKWIQASNDIMADSERIYMPLSSLLNLSDFKFAVFRPPGPILFVCLQRT